MVIGLERETYQVSEDDGTVEVCAVVMEGSIEGAVTLQLTTADLSAESKQHVYTTLHQSLGLN